MPAPRALYLACGGMVSEARGSLLRVVLGVERDPAAALTAALNFPDCRIMVRDLSSAGTMRDALREVPEVEVICTSTPCQDFSSACGKKAMERNTERSWLFADCLEWVDAYGPNAFIAENVIPAADSFQWSLTESGLRRRGYNVATWRLDAAEFGAPQHRRRAFMVATRQEFHLPRRPEPTHGPLRLPYVSAMEAIAGLPESEQACRKNCATMTETWKWILRGIPPGMNWRWIRDTAHVYPGNARRWEFILSKFKSRPGSRACGRFPLGPAPVLLTHPAVDGKMTAVHPGLPSPTSPLPTGSFSGGMTGLCARPGDEPSRVLLASGPAGMTTPRLVPSLGEWRVHRPSGDVYVRNEFGEWEPILTRFLSVPEYRRIMGVPDSYQFPAGIRSDDRYRIFGNGICPQAWQVVVKSVVESLESPRLRVAPVTGRDGDNWTTPQELFLALDKVFHFTLDAASSNENAKCASHFTIEDDGLSQPWRKETAWSNPPYSNIEPWTRKAAQEREATSVLLIPARTDTPAFAHVHRRACELWFLEGRVRFGAVKKTPREPSMLAIFRPGRVGPPNLRRVKVQEGVVEFQ